MSFFDTLAQMLVLFFAMACGYAAHKAGFLNDDGNRQLSALLLNVLAPCMILSSVIVGNMPDPGAILSFFGISVLYFAFDALFMVVVSRLLPGSAGEKGVWRFTMFFANIAFVGYPVVRALYGQEGLFYAIILSIPFNLFMYSVGPLLLVGVQRFSLKALLTPGMIASIAAFVIALGHIELPEALGTTLAFVGDLMVPMSLVLLGSLLAGLPVKGLFNSPKIWAISAVRLLAMPAVFWVLLSLMGVPPLMRGVAVVEMGMPAPVNGSLLCLEYGGDADCMARTIFLSTVLSIVTIPLVAALFP